MELIESKMDAKLHIVLECSTVHHQYEARVTDECYQILEVYVIDYI